MVPLKRVEIIGAGPAGLYTAILIKSAMPAARVRVTEQNPANATFGFGVVFSDQALDFLQADDPETHALITPLMERWRNMTLTLAGKRVVLDGIGFAAIGRLRLLEILQQRAREVGVELRFDLRLESVAELEADADLVVGADGLNSVLRGSDERAFAPALDYFGNYFAWFGTPRAFATLTQTFVHGPRGPLNAHHYRYAPAMSTFIVECDAASFTAYGFARMDESESAGVCTELFADALDGAPLLTNKSTWRRFPRLWCERWISGRRVILGDAAHTAHFSIGSGTRLALEDSIALVRTLEEHAALETALQDFQRLRQPIARKIVDAANTSARWYDDFARRMDLPAYEFAYSYLTRSGRIDRERLRRISPEFMAAYEANLQPHKKT
ncbi:MAG: FAD-dependent monooxygenase [Gammaproteobacteria bacterium]|nr:FAD-dependent monooxygenase [Gammaproteobacteria bacterium]MDH3448828.1 FAD-dependent monooxygenase [Gammaproteobacteria bacterium]